MNLRVDIQIIQIFLVTELLYMCLQRWASFTEMQTNSIAFSIILNDLQVILSCSSWRMKL